MVCLSLSPQVFEKAENSEFNLNQSQLILHHINARPHTAQLTANYLKDKKIQTLPHTPYSPDISLCDFWLFVELKKSLRGKKFQSEEELDLALFSFFDGFNEGQRSAAFKSNGAVALSQGDYIIQFWLIFVKNFFNKVKTQYSWSDLCLK